MDTINLRQFWVFKWESNNTWFWEMCGVTVEQEQCRGTYIQIFESKFESKRKEKKKIGKKNPCSKDKPYSSKTVMKQLDCKQMD